MIDALVWIGAIAVAAFAVRSILDWRFYGPRLKLGLQHGVDGRTLYTVKLKGEKAFRNVRFRGTCRAIDDDPAGGGATTRLWIVLEHSDGRRSLVAPHRIVWIEESAPAPTANGAKTRASATRR
ncbi:MAG TPA: hypothetical protein VEI02_01770 [Planctomycetota bacterium]|nr:hypothetical protein [Planctomycetota bacterium]